MNHRRIEQHFQFFMRLDTPGIDSQWGANKSAPTTASHPGARVERDALYHAEV